jgi:hypothetical protein
MTATLYITPTRKALLKAVHMGEVLDDLTADNAETYHVEYWPPHTKQKVTARIAELERAGLVHKPAPPQWRLTEAGSEALHPTTYLATLQLHWGGMFDSKSADNLAHLVRGTGAGTPGPALCGIDRFAKNGPGFSVGGGVTPHGVMFDPCPGCLDAARERFPGLPVVGMKSMSTRLAEALGVAAYDHAIDLPKQAGEPLGADRAAVTR